MFFICNIAKNSNKVKNFAITIKTQRQNKTMIKATHNVLGEIEFTEDHPFIYNDNIVQFKDLVKINPNFTSHEISDKFDEQYIYNFVGHPQQMHIDNLDFHIN